jgi:hypothetical protein
MKKIFVFALLLALLSPSSDTIAQSTGSIATAKNLVGIRISTRDAVINHSLTYKRFLNPSLAIEGLFSFTDPVALGFLLEKHTYLGPEGLSWFWGAGAYAGFSSGRRFGGQGVVGIDYILPTIPFNLSVDWKPELNFTKIFSFEPAAVGVSVRYVFGR